MSEPDVFIWIAIFAILSALVNGLGILVIFRYQRFAKKVKNYVMCFAAGMLISTPLMLALPKAIEKNSYAGFIALAGFLFMFFSNQIIRYRTREKTLAFGVTAAEGIGIHSLIDGVIYVVTFKISILIGVLSATGLVIHEFAEGIITYTVLTEAKVKEKTAMLYAFLAAALTTPIGAFVAYPFINKVEGPGLGLMLGFTAGVLIYLSASHLLPEAREEEEHSLLAFLGGVALASFIVLSKIF